MRASSTDAVVLHGLRPPLTIPRERVYFAFASGRFAYDCVSCQAKCCRGYGYQLQDGPELRGHIGSQPAVRFFLEPVDGGSRYRVRNCPPGCFFLTAGNLCGIQVGHGYDAKPETCRLFPFNGFRRVAGYLLVYPHPGLCPLEILPGDDRSDNSGYEPLLAAMSAHGINSDVPEVAAIERDVSQLVALEARIVELSESRLQAAGYAPFAAAQLAATSQAFGAPAGADATSGRDLEGLDLFRRLLYEVLGSGPAEAHERHPALVRTMVASTPFLRSQIVFPSRKQDAGQSRVGLERVPHVLMVLHALAALAREAGMRDVTYQTVVRLFMDHRALLTLLAHIDCTMTWKPGVLIDLPFTRRPDFQSRYLRVARALLPGRQAPPSTLLGQVLCEHLPPDGLHRVEFLKLLAPRLSGRIVMRAGAAGAGWWRPAVRPRLQRWLLGNLRHNLLMSLAARQSKRSLARPGEQG
jgi:hypothetical protein